MDESASASGHAEFDANLMTPLIVDKRLVYMTPEWKDAFRYAAQTADRLDLELAIASSPGWSETGGPWVQPKDGLKKLVWSATLIDGGKRFTAKLAAPPDVTGPFQTLPLGDPMSALSDGHHRAPPVYYADVVVIAYPVADAVDPPPPKVRLSTGEPLDGGKLRDGDLETVVEVPRGTAEQPGRPRDHLPDPTNHPFCEFVYPRQDGIFRDWRAASFGCKHGRTYVAQGRRHTSR